MPSAHSYWSASGFARDVACPGSKILSEGVVDKSGRDAAWGTVAHDIAEQCLLDPATTPESFLGTVVEQDGFDIIVEQDMVDVVNTYLDQVAELSAGAAITWPEQQVNYSSWLGVDEDEAWGTLDFSAYWPDMAVLLIADLKTGRGVTVSPVENEQLMLYAAGKLQELDALGLEVDTIHLAIIQPRVFSKPQTWSLSRADLEAWLTEHARAAVEASLSAKEDFYSAMTEEAWAQTYLRAGSHCREKFCKARKSCPAYRGAVTAAVANSEPATPDEFESLVTVVEHSDSAWLAAAWKKIALIRDWCNQVEAEVERLAHEGTPVEGTKLVIGKEGSRAWSDAAEAEKALKSMRLRDDQMYVRSVLSPTQVEKLVEKLDKDGTPKPVKEGQPQPLLSQRQWKKLQGLIARAPGKPVLTDASDPREEYRVTPVADAFEPVTDTPPALSADDIL